MQFKVALLLAARERRQSSTRAATATTTTTTTAAATAMRGHAKRVAVELKQQKCEKHISKDGMFRLLRG
jgi:hypothetical protein